MNCPNCGEKWHGCECSAEEMVDAARKRGRIEGFEAAKKKAIKEIEASKQNDGLPWITDDGLTRIIALNHSIKIISNIKED